MTEIGPEDDIRRVLDRESIRTSAPHDEAVLAAARAFANSGDAGASGNRAANGSAGQVINLRPRARTWLIPLGLAASFAFGVMVRVALEDPSRSSGPESNLMLPLDTTRGSAARAVPVEVAQPDDWYRYIQELVAAGETREAERHLRRFNELHPDYVYQP
jgi:hypothetical protein